MKKRICSYLLCLCVLLCGSGCTAEEPPAQGTKTPVVVAVADATSILAAKEYCNKNAFDFTELETLTDCAVSVENGKYEYLVCGEFEESYRNLKKLPRWLSGEESPCQFRRHRRCGFNP